MRPWNWREPETRCASLALPVPSRVRCPFACAYMSWWHFDVGADKVVAPRWATKCCFDAVRASGSSRSGIAEGQIPCPRLQIEVFTAHHDRSRCFSETVDGSFPVVVTGAWFPRSILGKAHALCAYVRCLLIAMHIAWVSWR